MSKLGDNTLSRIEKWMSRGTSLEVAFPKPDQRYRVQVAYEFFRRWLQNKDISPRQVCQNIARRDYQMWVNQAAQGNREAQAMMLALNVTVDDEGNIKPRTVVEIANDVTMCNHFIKWFVNQDDSMIRHKAMVLDNAEWLQREGKKQNNDKAVGKGIDVMMKIYDDFKPQDDASAEMPNAEINISDDPTIVRRDRSKYSDEDMRKAYRDFGLSEKKVQTLVEQSDGTWAIPEEDPERNAEEEEDVMVQRDPLNNQPQI